MAAEPGKKKRQHLWPYAWVALAAALVGGLVMREVMRVVQGGAVSAPLNISGTETTVDLDADFSLPVGDSVTAEIPMEELTSGTLVLLLGGQILLYAGITAASLPGVRALGEISRGAVFSRTTVRNVTAAAQIWFLVWLVSQTMIHFGANMVGRDLEATDQISSGGWGTQFIVGLVVTGAAYIVAGVLHDGKKAQDELEGLV